MLTTVKLFLFCFTLVYFERVLGWLNFWQKTPFSFKDFLRFLKTKPGLKKFLAVEKAILLCFLLWFLFIFLLPQPQTALTWFIVWVMALNLFFVLLAGKTLFKIVRVKLLLPVFNKATAISFLVLALIWLLLVLAFSPFGENAMPVFLFILIMLPFIVFLLKKRIM